MAKFLQGYQPVTWKNVNTGNPAQFFTGAIQGGDTVFDQQRQINEREDILRLNEALAGQRAGTPTPFDRRVDQGALLEAEGYEKTLKSNLLGAGLEQELQQIEIDESPERLELLRQEAQAKINSATSAAERNSLQKELNDLTIKQAKRQEANQLLVSAHDQHVEDKFQGFLKEGYAAATKADPSWRDHKAKSDNIFQQVQGDAQTKIAQYTQNRRGSEATGLPAHLRAATATGQAEAQAATRERSDAEVIRAFQEKAGTTEQSNYEASESDTRAFIIKDGKMAFGKPTENALSKSEAELMLGDAAAKSKTVQFDIDDLESDVRQNLSNAATNLSTSVAQEITDNVVAAKEEAGGGKMSAEEFANNWFREARKYRNTVFPEFRKAWEGGNQKEISAGELFDLASGNVVSSDMVDDPAAPPSYKLDTPETGQAGVDAIKATFKAANAEIDNLPQRTKQQYAGALNRIELLEKQVNSKRTSLEQKQGLIQEMNRMMQIIRSDVTGDREQDAAEALSNALNEAL